MTKGLATGAERKEGRRGFEMMDCAVGEEADRRAETQIRWCHVAEPAVSATWIAEAGSRKAFIQSCGTEELGENRKTKKVVFCHQNILFSALPRSSDIVCTCARFIFYEQKWRLKSTEAPSFTEAMHLEFVKGEKMNSNGNYRT